MQSKLKIIFAGTPEFAATSLQALINSEHDIIAVYTQPDRPSGRGRKLTASPVKQLALEYNLPVFQPLSLKNPEEQEHIKKLQADVMIVAAYGLILPESILKLPKEGCINIHASLLPRWRGASPIQHAILSGDKETGITIMQMDAGLDTGDMLKKFPCEIMTNDTSEALHDRLATLGAQAILNVLSQLQTLKPEKQNAANATYAGKIEKEDAHITWQEPAEVISRKIRAYNPWPVAFTKLEDTTIRIWEAQLTNKASKENSGVITAVSPDGIEVNNQILLKKIQLPGGKILAVKDILNAKHPFAVGKVFN